MTTMHAQAAKIGAKPVANRRRSPATMVSRAVSRVFKRRYSPPRECPGIPGRGDLMIRVSRSLVFVSTALLVTLLFGAAAEAARDGGGGGRGGEGGGRRGGGGGQGEAAAP